MTDIFWSWPPVTRTLIAATAVTSVLVHGGLIPFYPFVFLPKLILRMPPKIPEIWRVVTPFLITSPKFGILMDPYFLFTYGSAVERDSPRFREPGSFLVYLVFVMSVIVLTCGFYLSGFLFLHPLILAFAYTFSQENPNANVTIYIISFPAKFLPVALLALSFVMEGPESALHQATGLLAAHLYDFLTRIWPTFGGGRNYIVTPDFVKKWFIQSGTPTPQSRGFGTAFQPAQSTPRSNDGWSHSRGPGRRLGGD